MSDFSHAGMPIVKHGMLDVYDYTGKLISDFLFRNKKAECFSFDSLNSTFLKTFFADASLC